MATATTAAGAPTPNNSGNTNTHNDDARELMRNIGAYDSDDSDEAAEKEVPSDVFLCMPDWIDTLCSDELCVTSYMQFVGTVVASSLLACGIMIDFIAFSVFPKGWWASFVFIGYLLSAMCHLLFRSGRKNDLEYYMRESRVRCFQKGIRDGAYFLMGAAAASSIIIPIFLSHSEFIRWETNVMVSSGTTLIYISGAMYLKWFENPPGDDEDDEDMYDL